MLHYDDLPPLMGTQEEIVRAKVVRSACLRTIQRTQRLLMQDVGLRKRSPHTYHRQTMALKLTMRLYTQAAWWMMPFPLLEHEFRTTWGRIMAARYRLVEGYPRFIFSEREQGFAQVLAQLDPHLICYEIPCLFCRRTMIRPALKSLWEPEWCRTCMPTEIFLPRTDAEQSVCVLA